MLVLVSTWGSCDETMLYAAEPCTTKNMCPIFQVTGDANNLILVWNPASCELVHTFRGHRKAVTVSQDFLHRFLVVVGVMVVVVKMLVVLL